MKTMMTVIVGACLACACLQAGELKLAGDRSDLPLGELKLAGEVADRTTTELTRDLVNRQSEEPELEVNLADVSDQKPRELAVPEGAQKAAMRYFKLAESTHPILLRQDFAGSDGGVEYAVRTCKSKNSLVLIMVNRRPKAMRFALEVAGKRLLEPVYRRVYSPDGGKSWDTVAWQPPRAHGLYPWTVELAPFSAQTVTIRMR